METLGVSSPDLTGECPSKCFLVSVAQDPELITIWGNPEALWAELPGPIYTPSSSQRPFRLLWV